MSITRKTGYKEGICQFFFACLALMSKSMVCHFARCHAPSGLLAAGPSSIAENRDKYAGSYVCFPQIKEKKKNKLNKKL